MNSVKIRLVVILLWLCALTGNIFALGNRDTDGAQLKRVEVTGKVRLVGNSPMTSLVISGENREWHIESGEQDKLMHLQQQTVKVRALEYYQERFFGNGTFAGRYYFLKNIVVIE